MPDDLLPILEKLQLTWLGAFHALASVVALLAGLLSLIFLGRIKPGNTLGRLYLVSTALVLASIIGIYGTDGFGKPHILGIITIVFLYLAGFAHHTRLFGRISVKIEAMCLTVTFFVHVLTAITEISIRYPIGNPWIADREAPEVKIAAFGTLAAILIVGLAQAIFVKKK